jgi:hypothetical protein
MAASWLERRRLNHKFPLFPFLDNVRYLVCSVLFILTHLTVVAGGTPSDPDRATAGHAFLPAEGPGGPILVLTNPSSTYGRFYTEILKAEGWNLYTQMNISEATPSVLSNHDVVILAEMLVTDEQVSMLTNWVNAGGTLIAMRPESRLYALMGISPTGSVLSEGYQLFDSDRGPGVGLVRETIQFHGTANLFSVQSGTETIATLYADAITATPHPAATRRNVGANGGQAVMFAYDVAKSIVYTRQGNPAWSGQERDGTPVIRANDMFFGNAAGDPQPDWVNLDKVAIPQADELQRFLSNIILQGNYDHKPLPRFWFLPRGLKAAVVITGDDHALGGTAQRFSQYEALSGANNTPEAVADWRAIRGTSYIYPGTPITPAQALDFQAKGFEIALHLNTNCQNFNRSRLEAVWNTQWQSLSLQLPGVNSPVSNRTHCLAWSDWSTQAKVQAARGVRLDVNYYYWPGSWVLNRPGMFTGSGMPMRFADLDGSIIDCYQVATQLTDESEQVYPEHVVSLLDKAVGNEGYYGVFCANMHNDFAGPNSKSTVESNAIVNAAIARQIPVITAKQMLDWLDGRNGASFQDMAWSGNVLTFTVAADPVLARNIQAMLPLYSNNLKLREISFNGAVITYAEQMIKGVEYAMFNAPAGSYKVEYAADSILPVITGLQVQPHSDGSVTVNWHTNKTATSIVDFGISASSLTNRVYSDFMKTSHSLVLTGLSTQVTYYLRVTSVDAVGNVVSSPQPPLDSVVFRIPCVASGTISVFGLTCADQPINLRFVPTSGQAPFSLELNGNIVSGVGSNITFNSRIIAAAVSDVSLWSLTQNGGVASNDASSVELGMRFRSESAGMLKAIRFFKTVESGNGTFEVKLWNTQTGQLAHPVNATASVTFQPGSNASGWQTVFLPSPVMIEANTTYIASYRVPSGRYAVTNGAFAVPKINAPLIAPATGEGGSNGVYRYQDDGNMPVDSYLSSNYWVDVVFKPFTTINLSRIEDANGCIQDGASLQALYVNPVDCGILPVSLTDFRVSLTGRNATLKWTTASENGNIGFVVQRSRNGISWDSVGFVLGAVNSQRLLNYRFEDPNLPFGQHYFRLKQLDIDGRWSTSNVLMVQIRGILENALEQNYPNPARNTTSIRYSISSKSLISIDLYDIQGKFIRNLVQETKDAGVYTVSLNTEKMAKGTYYYLMKTKDFVGSRRLVVE